MQDKAPKPGELLFKNLFGDKLIDTSLKLIAEGLIVSRLNAERLLSDVKFLCQAQRLSSARFLLTTAKEELAKSYILLDMCRLDFEKHDSVLRRLCRAFYDHVSKHAYLKVLDIQKIYTSADAKTAWGIEVQRWWPSDPESGEPNMPHDTYFDREFPLYIDFGDYDRRWLIPDDTVQRAYFATFLGASPIDEVEKLIELWQTAELIGLCSPRVLKCMNAVFRKHYVGDDTKVEELQRLYEQVEKMVLHKVDGISHGSFMISPFVEWPLYHFV